MSDSTFLATRTAVQSLGEHVFSAARYAATGRIGLSVVPGGIATPTFGDDGMAVGLIDGNLVIQRRGELRQTMPTTLRAAGAFVGITPGAPATVYTPTTACDLDATLAIDAAALGELTSWYQRVDAALTQFRSEISADEPSEITLWPEHFDVAIRAADINYGGLGGDASHPEPYLYVGPPTEHLARSTDPLWNQSFGASRAASEMATVDDAVAFFRQARDAAALLS